MEDKELDTIFKNAFSAKESAQVDNWDEFEVKLYKKMFYKFSYNRFNVYYMSLIIACFFSCLILIPWQYINSFSQEDKPIQNYVSSPDSIKIENSTPDNFKKEEISKKKKSQPEVIQKQDTTMLNPVSNVVNATKKDSSSVDTSDQSISKKVPSPPAPIILKRKKTVYITPPRDTIVNIDTVKVKKKRVK
jgi:hypothetical protein